MKKMSVVLSLLLFAFSTTYAQFDYQAVIKKYVQNQIKQGPCAIDQNFKEFKNWQVMNYPTNNFGILTLYTTESNGTYSFYTDMWNTLQYKQEEIPAKYADWLAMDGYSATGTGGGQIDITDDKDKKKLGLGFVFPKLLSVMGLNFGFNKDKTTVVNLTSSGIDLRCLRRPESNPYLRGDVAEKKNGRKVNADVMDHFKNKGDFAIVTGDAVLKDLVITITTDLATTANIESKFGAGPKVFDSADLKFGYERVQAGKYKFTISTPVIVARLIKVQPQAGTSSGDEVFESWDAVTPESVPLPQSSCFPGSTPEEK